MTVAPSQSLPSGTVLYRVADPVYGLSFKWVAPAPFRGGRFDCVDGSYGYSYFAGDPAVALAEVYTRDLAPTPHMRTLPADRLANAVLLTVETTTAFDIQLLHGRHLTAIGETAALTKSEPNDYDRTRAVAAQLVADHSVARGLRYRPRHDEDGFAYMLYTREEERELSTLVTRVEEDVPLGTGDGLELATTLLAQYNVSVER